MLAAFDAGTLGNVVLSSLTLHGELVATKKENINFFYDPRGF